jgi:hypothetical protein
MIATMILALGLVGQEQITITNKTGNETIGVSLRCSSHGRAPSTGWAFIAPGQKQVFAGHQGYFKVTILNSKNIQIHMKNQILITADRGSEEFLITKAVTTDPDAPRTEYFLMSIDDDK